ncbi:MAG: prepilin-type N-terminal cleavage/methylation domain-containing protein [Geminicoccaceae bacterium]
MSLDRMFGNSVRERGFTLMELLVAMTLLGILMAALFGGLRLGVRVWEASDRTLDHGSQEEIVRGFLRARLEQILPVTGTTSGSRTESMFKGQQKSLRFVSSMPISFGSQPYLLELALRLRDGPDPASDLILKWRALDETSAVGEFASGERVLIEDVADIAFGYLGGGGQQNGAWIQDWQGHETLPSLIRFELAFKAADRRRWSPLVVSPMIDQWYDTNF